MALKEAKQEANPSRSHGRVSYSWRSIVSSATSTRRGQISRRWTSKVHGVRRRAQVPLGRCLGYRGDPPKTQGLRCLPMPDSYAEAQRCRDARRQSLRGTGVRCDISREPPHTQVNLVGLKAPRGVKVAPSRRLRISTRVQEDTSGEGQA